MKVIKLTNNKGRFPSMPGNELNTWFGLGHPFVANLVVPYDIRNAPKVKASLIRKYHIINLPYSTLKGLLPPLQYFVAVVAGVVVAIFRFSNYVCKFICSQLNQHIKKKLFYC
jgi:hypothetical protein